MSARFTLTVAKASPSLNTINGRHWSHYRQQKKLWMQLILVAKMEAKVYGRPMLARAKVSIERFGSKLLDGDNLVGGCKNLIDCLKALGIIVDDSPKHIDLTVSQHLSKNIRTVIHIEELTRATC